ncbi:unnamed protein product [Diatraea saccharalis]|uniref:Uncharacterized protein n=1 Tax=Diatraea saccharalis TaxID=40085 RepID=A0A9N9R5C5_9NEOP|nr:unnamed protein product [Diatraea saccharalis]
MFNSNMEDRRPIHLNKQGQSGGNRRGLRDAQRAYERRNNMEELRDWSYQPQEFDPSRIKTRKPTNRSDNFRKKIEAQRDEKHNPPSLRPSTKETPPRDEPLYDIGPHSTLIPLQDVHVQNFEFSGFIPLIEETYEKMRGIDPRLNQRLPLSLFTHVCCNHLNLQVAEVARQNGQNIFGVLTDLREVLPDYQCVPKSITDYISHVSNSLTVRSNDLHFNCIRVIILFHFDIR